MVTAYQGFCTFRRHDRAVNWLGFASAVGLYVGAYLAVASAVPAGGTVPVAAAAVVAAAAAGLWLGWLYGRAVGSPYGNVMLALGIPPLVPWPVYATPFPGLAATGDTWAHHRRRPGRSRGVGLGAVGRGPRVRADGRPRRLRAGGDAVRLPGGRRGADRRRVASRGPTVCRGVAAEPEERVDLRLDVRGWLVGLVVAPAVAVAVYGRTTYGDRTYSGIMLLAMLVLVHASVRPESDGGRQSEADGR